MKGDLYLAFLFGSLAYSNYMMYTQIHGRGGGYGGGGYGGSGYGGNDW